MLPPDRRAVAVALALLSAFVCDSGPMAAGNVNLVAGQRRLEDDRGHHHAFGIHADFGSRSWPLRLDAGLQASFPRDRRDEANEIVQFDFGLIALPRRRRVFRPYAGAGLSTAVTQIGRGSARDRVARLGFYFRTGFYWRLGRRLNVGVDGRLLAGTPVDHHQLSLLIGSGF